MAGPRFLWINQVLQDGPQGQGSSGVIRLRLLRLCRASRPRKGFTILKCLGKISKRIFHDM